MLIKDPVVQRLATEYSEQQLMSALNLLRENRLHKAEEARIHQQKEGQKRILKD